jgi:aryl-alcohol dehydrogenase-like predicted oxidoreductase
MTILEELKQCRPGFGSWQLGSEGTWTPMTVEDGVSLVREAVSKGIRLFDTAPGYSAGRSETIFGLALQDRRDQVFLMSKFGHRADGRSDFSSAAIESAVLDSLSRLKTNHLDALLLHNPPFEILKGETDHFDVLRAMKKNGLIRSFGVSCDTPEEFEAAIKIDGLEVIEVLCNVFFQACVPLFPMAEAGGIAVIAKVPLDSGWLSGKYDEHTVFSGVRARWSPQDIVRRATLVSTLKEIAGEEDLTKHAIGYLFALQGLTTAIPGIRSMDQLDHIINVSVYRPTPAEQSALWNLYKAKIATDPLPW